MNTDKIFNINNYTVYIDVGKDPILGKFKPFVYYKPMKPFTDRDSRWHILVHHDPLDLSYGFSSYDEALNKGKEIAEKALALKPSIFRTNTQQLLDPGFKAVHY